MKHKFIAVSRQFGSGGRTVGKEVAERLGIPCYDQELIEMLAQKSGFSEAYIKENSEDAVYTNLLSSIFSDRVYDTPITQDVLWEAQRKVILELAEKGPCVIVGRCADYILKENPECLRVYIHADAQKRAERIVQVYGEREDSPTKRIADKDKRRKAYYQKYTGEKWGDAENFHITLDSGELGIETCVDILKQLY